MKNKLSILGMYFMLLVMITGCGSLPIKQGQEVKQQGAEVVNQEEPLYNTAFEKYDEDGVIALIINNPEQEVIEGLTYLETYTHHENSEKLLIIPKYNGTKIEVKKVDFQGEKPVEGETLYTKSSTEDDYGLLVETFKAEGMPEVLVSVSIGDRQTTYVVAEDGKDGIPKLMYLTDDGENKTKEEIQGQETDEEEQIIQPMVGEEVLEGYSLLDTKEIDINNDGQMEEVQVYSTAGISEEGELVMDDGNGWKLIVRKDEKLYPVFDDYIQLGTLEYKSYMAYEDDTNVFHLLISSAEGAGLTMYDCYYDEEQDVFISKKVYQTTGNIGFHGIEY